MKRNKLIVVFIMLSLLMACKGKYQEAVTSPDTKLFEVTFHKKMINTEKISISSFIDSITYVVLETTKDNLIGEISDVEFINDRYYLLDRRLNTIFVFDKSGHFIFKINKIGQGPEEYIALSAFDVNPRDSTIHVFDQATSKMLIYKDGGRLLRYFHINEFVNDFAVFPDGSYLFYSPTYNIGEYHRGMWRADSNGKFKKQLVSIDKDFKYGGVYPKYFCRINDETMGLMGGEDVNRIYHVTEHSFVIPYQVNVDIQIPDWIKKQSVINNMEKYAGQIYSKNTYFETSNYLMFVVFDMKTSLGIFYDKLNKKTTCVIDMINDIDSIYGSSPIGATNNQWVGSLDPDYVAKNNVLKKKFPNVNINTNPVLQIFHLK